jgi:hypothetical protein
MKSPPGCDLFIVSSVDQDLTAALSSLAEATGAGDAAAFRDVDDGRSVPRNQERD